MISQAEEAKSHGMRGEARWREERKKALPSKFFCNAFIKRSHLCVRPHRRAAHQALLRSSSTAPRQRQQPQSLAIASV